MGGFDWLFGGGNNDGGYDVVYPKQYSFTEPRVRLSSDFITQNLQRIMDGKFPAWYEGISPILKAEQQKSLKNAYYGDGFSPGVLNETAGYDAARGLGRGAAASKTYGTQLDKYSQGWKTIDDYISKLGYDAQREGAYKFPELSNQQAQVEHMLNQPVGVFAKQPEPSPFDTIMQGLGGILPLFSGDISKGVGNIFNMFNKKNAANPNLLSGGGSFPWDSMGGMGGMGSDGYYDYLGTSVNNFMNDPAWYSNPGYTASTPINWGSGSMPKASYTQSLWNPSTAPAILGDLSMNYGRNIGRDIGASVWPAVGSAINNASGYVKSKLPYLASSLWE